MEILLIVRDFQPRIMNYVKIFDGMNVLVFTVDQWIFERDIERGFLGEATVNALIFPYSPIANKKYLHAQEVKLKKRLILELLENLVLDFPELAHQIHIKPQYFIYEAMLSRARVYPPMMYDLLSFTRESGRKEVVKDVLDGYLQALKELEEESLVNFSEGYVTISRKFVEKAKSRKVHFINLLRPAQETLFMSLLGLFPNVVSFLAQNREFLARFLKADAENSQIAQRIEDPQRYLFVPTARGLVPLTSRLDIEGFARKVIAAGKDARVKVEKIGGVLNDAYIVNADVKGEERRVVVKRFKDWSSFKWFPLTLWTIGTRSFAVLGRSRLERECAVNQFLSSKGFSVPKLLYVNHAERLVFMEYVEGESLEKVIKRILGAKNVNAIKNDLRFLRKVGKTFAGIHATSVSLGDTKPENAVVGNDGKIYLLDFEQASHNGDKVWDVAEFLYYAGHYCSPFASIRSVELVAKTFVDGYLEAGGDVCVVRKAASPKYTKVFSVFTLPHIMFVISSICRKTGKVRG